MNSWRRQVFKAQRWNSFKCDTRYHILKIYSILRIAERNTRLGKSGTRDWAGSPGAGRIHIRWGPCASAFCTGPFCRQSAGQFQHRRVEALGDSSAEHHWMIWGNQDPLLGRTTLLHALRCCLLSQLTLLAPHIASVSWALLWRSSENNSKVERGLWNPRYPGIAVPILIYIPRRPCWLCPPPAHILPWRQLPMRYIPWWGRIATIIVADAYYWPDMDVSTFLLTMFILTTTPWITIIVPVFQSGKPRHRAINYILKVCQLADSEGKDWLRAGVLQSLCSPHGAIPYPTWQMPRCGLL